jgi:hypothetical protein
MQVSSRGNKSRRIIHQCIARIERVADLHMTHRASRCPASRSFEDHRTLALPRSRDYERGITASQVAAAGIQVGGAAFNELSVAWGNSASFYDTWVLAEDRRQNQRRSRDYCSEQTLC